MTKSRAYCYCEKKKVEVEEMVNDKKAVMIGCGFVGSACVFSLMQSSLFSEIVLIDTDRERAKGEAMDISHGIAFAKEMKIYEGDYREVKDAGIVIITAGANQKPEESRLDLVQKNVDIFRQIIPAVMSQGFQGIFLVVANPVDILTYAVQKLSGLPDNRVIGSGTVLDTARLKHYLGRRLEVDSRNVHAFIMGEHGDSEFPVWSKANVSGISIDDFCAIRGYAEAEKLMTEIETAVKRSAYEIIQRKNATYYGVAMAVKRICEAIVRDEKSILTVSALISGEYGIEDVVLSVPCIVGKEGIERKLPLTLSEKEANCLKKSAVILRETIRSCDYTLSHKGYPD